MLISNKSSLFFFQCHQLQLLFGALLTSCFKPPSCSKAQRYLLPLNSFLAQNIHIGLSTTHTLSYRVTYCFFLLLFSFQLLVLQTAVLVLVVVRVCGLYVEIKYPKSSKTNTQTKLKGCDYYANLVSKQNP